MIKVIQPGLYCSLQDNGRFGFRKYGVPLSGTMDRTAAHLANALLGNDGNALVMEFANPGPTLFFSKSTLIAITGAHFDVLLNGSHVGINKSLEVAEGSTLQCGRASTGAWGYLAVNGGFASEMVLGSGSYFSGITAVSRIGKGDELEFFDSNHHIGSAQPALPKSDTIKSSQGLKVFPGPEFDALPNAMKKILGSRPFVVSARSNRMAYTLEHAYALFAPEIITGPVQPGTVQLTPSGTLIVLLRDAQTTGGYARIFQISDQALDVFSQKRAGDNIEFVLF
jgi:biotin-dependent carboxylase-like uncharacterized protein